MPTKPRRLQAAPVERGRFWIMAASGFVLGVLAAAVALAVLGCCTCRTSSGVAIGSGTTVVDSVGVRVEQGGLPIELPLPSPGPSETEG